MKLEKMTLTVRASKNYQVAEATLEISEFTQEDVKKVEKYLVNEAITTLNTICSNIPEANDNTAPVVEKDKYVKTKEVKMATDKQKEMLFKFGYVQQQLDNLTSFEASRLIKECVSENRGNKYERF